MKYLPPLVALVFCAAGIMFAQVPPKPSLLSLQQAASLALEKNPLRKAALAEAKATLVGVREARSFLMPHVSFSEHWLSPTGICSRPLLD